MKDNFGYLLVGDFNLIINLSDRNRLGENLQKFYSQ
jgi:hypothetical protein